MEKLSLADLRIRLASALDLRLCGSDDVKYYVDPEGRPMGLVRDWFPDAPDKIIKVIERYGLHVGRTVSPLPKPKPGEEDNIVWKYNVWSRNPVYRTLGNENGLSKQNGARVVASDLTTAVLTWAVLRAERVKDLRNSPLESHLYSFHALREKVYVSPAE